MPGWECRFSHLAVLVYDLELKSEFRLLTMCGRYTLTSPHDAIADYFETGTAPELAPRYNLAPSQESLIVKTGETGKRSAHQAQWGFPLSAGAKSRLVINARSEDVEKRSTFRESFAKRRCLVPANGFFEWAKIGRTRQPYYFTSRASSLLGFAGLWSENGSGKLIYVILTTASNAVVGRIHDRMPVILERKHHAAWLHGKLPEPTAQAMVQPWPAADMLSEAVGMRVNTASFDDPSCIRALDGQVDLFTN